MTRVSSRRILLTGLSTYWGGRLAQSLERDPAVEAIIGVDRTPPKVALDRTEFVQVADSHSHIRRIVEAAEIDTVVDTRLVVDSIVTTPRRAHENNVIGTMDVLTACNGPDSPVRKVVFKSSAHYYGCEQDDPAFFTERMTPPPRAADLDRARHRRGRVGRPRVRRAQPGRHGHAAAVRQRPRPGPAHVVEPPVRRCPPSRRSSASTPACSSSTRTTSSAASSTRSATRSPGVHNCAADGVLALSEVAGLLGKPFAPLLPPIGTGLARGPDEAHRDPPPAGGPAADALRPRPRQPPPQGDRLPLPLHDPRDDPPPRRAPAHRADPPRRAAPRATATSASSRSSCATARASGRAPASRTRPSRTTPARGRSARPPRSTISRRTRSSPCCPRSTRPACGPCTSTRPPTALAGR